MEKNNDINPYIFFQIDDTFDESKVEIPVLSEEQEKLLKELEKREKMI